MAEETASAAPSAPTTDTPATPETGAPPPSAVATPEKTVVTPEDASAQIEATENFDTLAAMLDEANAPKSEEAQPEATASTTAPTPAPAAAPATTDGSQPPATPAAAAPAGPGDVTTDDEIEDGGENLPKNFRFHTTDPARARYLKLLRQEPGANPIDLALRAGYTMPPSAAAPAATPNEPAAEPAAAVQQSIDEALKPMRDEIEALQAQKRSKREAFEFTEADEIGEQILDKKLALERKKTELEANAAYEAEFQAAYKDARAEAASAYPDTLVKGSPQFEAVAREVAYLETTEPGFFDDPNYPVELIKRMEKTRPDLFKKSTTPGTGAAPAAAAPAPGTPPAVTPPTNAQPNQPARPVGQVAAATDTATQPLTRQAAVDAIDNITDPDEIARLADLIGTPGGNQRKRR